jgi:hypothetical protein
MSTEAHDEIVRHICAEITATETVFPGTDLRLIYEISAHPNSWGSGGLTLRGSPQRKATLIFSGVMGPMLLRSPTALSRRRALCRAARPKGAPLGPGKRSRDSLHWRDLR